MEDDVGLEPTCKEPGVEAANGTYAAKHTMTTENEAGKMLGLTVLI